MELNTQIIKITKVKWVICDDKGNEICRVIPSTSNSFAIKNRRPEKIAKFISDAINYYSARCDDSEIPCIDMPEVNKLLPTTQEEAA